MLLLYISCVSCCSVVWINHQSYSIVYVMELLSELPERFFRSYRKTTVDQPSVLFLRTLGCPCYMWLTRIILFSRYRPKRLYPLLLPGGTTSRRLICFCNVSKDIRLSLLYVINPDHFILSIPSKETFPITSIWWDNQQAVGTIFSSAPFGGLL